MQNIEGKKIKFITRNKEVIDAIVVNCDEDIGITIVSADDPNWYLFCMHCPSSPHYKKCEYKLNEENTKKLFKDICNMLIKDGIFDCNTFHKTMNEYTPPKTRAFLAVRSKQKSPSSEYCAFNQ